MATLKEANDALAKLQSRIDAGSMAGAQLAVIGQYLYDQCIIGTNLKMVIVDEAYAELLEKTGKDGVDHLVGGTVTEPLKLGAGIPSIRDLQRKGILAGTAGAFDPLTVPTVFSQPACPNCIHKGFKQPGCKHD